MSRPWPRGKLGLLGLSAAAIAAAAVPDESERASIEAAETRSAGRGASPAVARPPGREPLHLDVERLRRLAPAAAPAAPADDGAYGVEAGAAAAGPPAPEIVNAFVAKSWYVPPPPPPPAKPAPPPKPTAPPLPFTYVGNYDDLDGPPVVLLLRGDRLYAVAAGDAIDGNYRVERIEPGQVELTYLPLQQKQVLRTGHAG